MQVDFWQISRDPPAVVAAMIAHKVRSTGGKLVIVSEDKTEREAISKALWEHYPTAFLANGMASDCNGADGTKDGSAGGAGDTPGDAPEDTPSGGNKPSRQAHDARQPILIAASTEQAGFGDGAAVNGAEQIVLADGLWRDEALQYQRAFLLFGEARIADARLAWKTLGQGSISGDAETPEGEPQAGAEPGEGAPLTRRYFAQQDGKWVQKA